MYRVFCFLSAVFLVMFILAGCSDKLPANAVNVDTSKSLDQVRALASRMNDKQLSKAISNYKKALDKESEKLRIATEQLKQLPADKKLSEDAHKLQDEISLTVERISKISERMQVYIEQRKSRKNQEEAKTL
ncbi:hypothetical protein [Sedimentisphaera salicampi]|uniref:Lipoprotein n=1 Tax=Sedimentisphaera salicampi TaxID=1941349 RepID=A0A1W6LP78_9BACT|nr:hypothetical protein [Sedimentisphaera salicampi]ARN57590.1 hypothetical protein STSP1_02005 [Sedimentisphaera salicampi]OXU14337.1 hypothetical protein SMSP1_01920 [Sedimentisphaera salicampi]